MVNAGIKVILKDNTNRVVRSYLTNDDGIHELIVYRDGNRLDLVKNSAALKKEGVEFDVIEKVQVKSLTNHPQRISPFLTLAILEVDDKAVPALDLMAEDDDERIVATMKWSGGAHLSALALILTVGFIIQRFFTPIAEEDKIEVVVIPPMPKTEVRREKAPTVKMAEKVTPQAKQVRKSVMKPVPQKKAIVKTATRVQKTQGQKIGKNPELGSLKSLDRIGGIGTSNAANRGSGFGNSSGAFGSGSGGTGGGIGSGRSGGIKNALSGKGLVGGLSGAGSQSYGASGYGHGDFGGGRKGHGGASVGETVGNLMVPVFEDSDVSGGLTREQVEAVVRRNQGKLLYCYEKALQASPGLKGRLTLEWIVGASGSVKSVRTASSSLKAASVENCVTASVRGWKFPRPVGGVNVEISYPFDFGRMNLMAKGG